MTASFKKLFRVLVLPVFLFLACVTAHGQQNSALSGNITDKSGAAIPAAHVVLKNPATGTSVSTDTNSAGAYNFPALDIGTYDLTVTAKGFETEVQKGVVINISQSVQSDLSLSVGAVDQTVTVEANALQIQTDTNVLSTLVSADQISEIATENRNVTALVALGLGVSSLLPDSNTPTSVGSSASISVNGLRESHNIWLIDGGEADDRGGAGGISIMPSQDSIAQIETLASNYPPDYGISSGATISLAIKSGTRHFHGEAWEFNRNTDFNANSYSNKNTTPITPRSKLNYNIFGANIGGPLFIPHLYNDSREKTFFFWNEEWRRLIQGGGTSTNPTIDAADFPVAGQNLTYVAPKFAPNTVINVPNSTDPAYLKRLAADGLTPGGTFPGNVIPFNLFDASAVAYLGTGLFPKPNVLSNDNYTGTAVLPTNVRDDVVRVDHNFNEKWHLLAHYIHDSVSQGESGPMAGWSGGTYSTLTSTFNNPSNSAAVKLAGTISPNLLVEASFLYDGNIINIVNSSNGNLSSAGTSYGVQKFFANGATSLPGITLGSPYKNNGSSPSESPGSAPWHNAAEDYAPKVDVSYTLGKHALKFGLGYNRYTKNQKLFLDAEGDASFNGSQTGDSAVDFILGFASGYSESQAAPIRHYVNQTISTYGYDTWQVNKNLSLQLGLRYDALPHAWERQNQVANFNPAAYSASQIPTWNPDGTLNPNGPGFSTPSGATQAFYLNGMELAGVNGTPVGLVQNDYKTLQPRVGFSQKLDSKTVLRGGIGTFYERLQGNDIYNAATSAPFANTPSANNVYFSNPHTSFVTGSTATIPVYAQGLTSLAQIYRAPAVAQYSIGVQRELKPSIIGIFQYVGNSAWHQNIDRQINNYSLSTPLIGTLYSRANAGDPNNHSGTNPGGQSLPNGNTIRQYQGFAGITQQENTTNGGYNGLQIGVRSAGYHGLSGEVDYTYSHEIDITSGDLSGVSNPYDLKYDKGSGSYDRRHIFSTNYVYKLPFFSKTQGLEHSLLGGWEVAGTFIKEAGVPVAPSLGLNYDPVGLGGGYTNRPNISGKLKYTHTRAQWFDPSQFTAPTPVWAGGPNLGFGDAGKDAIVGPGRTNFTTSLYKSFAITEHSSFQFRVESFNTFNHTEFSGLSGSALNNTYDPRTIEFGGKLIF